MVTVFYLARRNKPIWFVVLPMIVMIIMPLWALLWNMFNPETRLVATGKLLAVFHRYCHDPAATLDGRRGAAGLAQGKRGAGRCLTPAT